MSEEYTSYRYLWAPRPHDKPIPEMSVKMMAKLGYVAQKKKNGTCSMIFTKGGESIHRRREGPDVLHKGWVPNSDHDAFFGSLGPKWNVFAAELLHSKGPEIKNELFIFDVLVHNGMYLTGLTFLERMAILQERWGARWKDEGDQYRVHKHVTVAKTFTQDFGEIFANLGPLDEGLVFKLPKSKLAPCVSDSSNMSWAQKCRSPKAKTYSF